MAGETRQITAAATSKAPVRLRKHAGGFQRKATMDTTFLCGDNLELLRAMPDDSVDLVFTSPPYEDARTYGIGYKAKGAEWVDWCLPRIMECLRVCRGLVAWNVEGRTKDFRYSNAPMRLAVAVEDAGAIPRKPIIYKRYGIPGSGGPDWLRNDYEFVLCWTKRGRLPWADPTACGHPPKCAAGGPPSHRKANGARVAPKPYQPPAISNPGNVIDCGAVGGGNMGAVEATDNEAPFPLKLAEFMVRTFCPPGGVVLDPHGGSGTVADAAIRAGRRTVLMDIRDSQLETQRRRVARVVRETTLPTPETSPSL